MSLPAVAELLSAFGRAAEGRGLRWYLFGAHAVLFYGPPRFTADVDITVEPLPGGSTALVDALAPFGFTLRFPLSSDARDDARLLPMVHAQTHLPLDLVIAGPGLDEEFLDRARRIDVAGVATWVVSPEDLLAMKVLAGRRKDLSDARGILIQQRGLLDLARTKDVLSALEAATGDKRLMPRLARLLKATSNT